MKRISNLVLCLICAILTSCMSEAEMQAAREAQDKADAAECRKLGFSDGLESQGNCILKLREIRAQERAALHSSYYVSPRVGMGWGWERY